MHRNKCATQFRLMSIELSGVKVFMFLFVKFGMVLNGSVRLISYVDKSGRLTEFLQDIPHDVQQIEIRNSHIPVIEYIDPFPDLQQFWIIKSSLEHFPDLSNVSNSLRWLSFYVNELRQIDWIAPMKKLAILDLSRNHITSLPELSNVSSNLSKLILPGNKISRM